ncbi:hypothetical protein 2016_scaffold57_00082 [Bacteriophage sp.]|nr:hypothetical protein 2016_scaffold57_00082 [Bacteriophage sp.]
MLQVHLVAVLRKPVRRFGDFLLGHVVAVAVLLHRFVHNAGNIVALCVRLDNSAVGRKRRFSVVRFLQKELTLIGCLVYQ